VKKRRSGLLLLSGGHDEAEGTVAKRLAEEVEARGGKLVICTAPSGDPAASAETHVERFRKLGVKQVEVLDLRIREDAMDPAAVQTLEGAAGVFFTGGDQLRFTATMADSLTFRRIRQIHEDGGVVAGTSAGSAAMPQTMFVSGEAEIAPEAATIGMAPGLGFLDGIVLDTHFAERGRIGRLLAAVAQNPKNVGLGIDEDTAVVVSDGGFDVIGEGSVYVIDGSQLSFSSLSSQSHRGVTSIFGIRLHVLADGDHFDLATREPRIDEVERRGERDETRDTARRSSER
jgi:cyanophycinase